MVSVDPIFLSNPENSNSLKISSSFDVFISLITKSSTEESIFTSVRMVTSCLLNNALSLSDSNLSFIFSFLIESMFS